MQVGNIDFTPQTSNKKSASNLESKNGGFANMMSNLLSPEVSQKNSELNVIKQIELSLSNEELLVLENLLNQSDVIDYIKILLGNHEGIINRLEEGITLEDLTAFFKISDVSTRTKDEELLLILSQFLSVFNIKENDSDHISDGTDFKMFNLNDLDHDPNNLLPILQKVREQLEVLKQNRQTNRLEYLNQVFSATLQDVKEYKQNHTHAVTGLSDDLLIQERMLNTNQMTVPLNNNGKTVSTSQLIQQFEEILARSQFINHGPSGGQKLFIKLYPEHLGALRIELIQNETGLVARLMTSTMNAKELLESQLQHLKQVFNMQNIPIEKIEISTQLNFQERFNPRDPQQQEQQHQPQPEEQQQETQTFEEAFAELLINEEV